MELNPLVYLAISVAFCLLVVVGFRIFRRTSGGESLRHCRCTSCGQKLRFQASRAGRQGRCPRCGSMELLTEHANAPRPTGVYVGRRVDTPITRTPVRSN